MVDPRQVTFFVNSDKETNERKRRPNLCALRVPIIIIENKAAAELARNKHSLKQPQQKTLYLQQQ